MSQGNFCLGVRTIERLRIEAIRFSLLHSGRNVVLGYWGDEKATRETFLPGGWLRTGDRFRANKDGVL